MPPEGKELRPHAHGDAKRLEELLDRSEKLRVRGMPLGELRELIALYRHEAARLARLRERSSDEEELRWLNALCVRAHTLLQSPARLDGGEGESWKMRVAVVLRRTWHAQMLAWALLGIGILVGAPLARSTPEAISVFVPRGLGYSPSGLERLATSPQARAEFLEWEATSAPQKALFGSYLFVHNTRVGLLSFAAGILGGVPTLLLQIYNGMVLGAFASIFLTDALAWRFLAWILPHGVPELTAITICAAGGLLLGEAIASPGRRGRAAALREAFPSALVLFGVSLPFFVLAAFIESSIRESALSTAARYGVVAGCLLLLASLLLATRWALRTAPPQADWLSELARRDHLS